MLFGPEIMRATTGETIRRAMYFKQLQLDLNLKTCYLSIQNSMFVNNILNTCNTTTLLLVIV